MVHLSVSEVARRIGARPKDISDLFYARELRDDLCPIIAGRRIIPEAYLPADTENDRIPAFLCTDGVFGMDKLL